MICWLWLQPAQAAPALTRYELSESTISYEVVHPAHRVLGSSKEAKGKITCEAKLCRLLVGVPVKSFVSGDSNRDSHMLEVTKAALHPMVVFKTEFPQEYLRESGKTAEPTFRLSFAGKEKSVQLQETTKKISGKELQADLKLSISLTEFGVERPALLMVPVKDSVAISVTSRWHSP